MKKKYAVTDGDLGTLLIKIHELITRLKKGLLPITWVLDVLQKLIEGGKDVMIVPTINPTKLLQTRTRIKIGGVTPEGLQARIQKKGELDDRAVPLMKHPDFTTLMNEEWVDLVTLTPRDLGYTREPSQAEFLDPKYLEILSVKNLNGYIIENCPAEVAPHLHEFWVNRPVGKVIWIAMKAMKFGGMSMKFNLAHRDELEGIRLYAYYWTSDKKVPLDTPYVFRLRNRTT
ncbi:MAG: hypothetical protein WCO09_02705 [bacterium]